MKKYDFVIGIDTGVNTGISIWNRNLRKIDYIKTDLIHRAMKKVEETANEVGKEKILVRVEDARQRKWFGKMDQQNQKYGAGVREGAGSVKRDASVWEDFLTDLGVDFEMVAPKNNKTKMSADYFKKVTGIKERTSEHARDATFLCFGY